MPGKPIAPSKEVLAELHRTARSVPDLDNLAHWISKLQGLYTLYKRALKREARNGKT